MKFLIYKRTERANGAPEHRILFSLCTGGKTPHSDNTPQIPAFGGVGKQLCSQLCGKPCLPPQQPSEKHSQKSLKQSPVCRGLPYLYPLSMLSVALTLAVTLNVLLDSPTTEGKILFLKSAQLHSSSSFKVGR